MNNRADAAKERHFVFLQGPHGPFFAATARQMQAAGAKVSRIGFNKGDEIFWRGLPGFMPYHGEIADWSGWIEQFIAENNVTDIVCYGASRPRHQIARAIAIKRNLHVHVFEEGYLRPYWITYERGGTNAESPLVGMSVAKMREALGGTAPVLRKAPDRWGDVWQHVFWGAAYHAALLSGRKSYPSYSSHRTPDPWGELRLYLRQLVSMPSRRMRRHFATRAVRNGKFPYHVALLQLAHDANFRDNSPFSSQEEFLDIVFKGFFDGAPLHHHLVIKAHPLEDGREPLPPLIKKLSKVYGLQSRVHFLTGGKIAALLDLAESAVTVNSTSAEQALWRGLPLKAFGAAVYNRSEFTSDQPVHEFFADPRPPDTEAYADYRRFLLATSQIPGGFYSFGGRRRLLRQIPDLMLNELGPYKRLNRPDAATTQHLALVQ